MATQLSDIKTIRGLTPFFIVDGFNFVDPACASYFLTHYHGDHTCGLHAAFDLGTIYCSEVTKRLVVRDMGVKDKLVVALPLDGSPVEIEGVAVTAMDANHCPGAIM